MKLLVFIILNLIVLNSYSALDRNALCQKHDFGIKKNIEYSLNRKGLYLDDPNSLYSKGFLLYLNDLLSVISLNKTSKIILSEHLGIIKKIKSDKSKVFLNPSLERYLEFEKLESAWNDFCNNKVLRRPRFNALSSLRLPTRIFKKLFSKKELSNLITKSLGIEIISKSSSQKSQYYAKFSKNELAKVLALFSMFSKRFIKNILFISMSRMKKDFAVKGDAGIYLDRIKQNLKFSDLFFKSSLKLTNHELLYSLGQILWQSLNKKTRNKFIAISWVKKNLKYHIKNKSMMINDDAFKSPRDDFIQHFIFYIKNQRYLKSKIILKYKFFKFNYMEELLFPSGVSSQVKIEEIKAVKKNRVIIELMYSKRKSHYIPAKFYFYIKEKLPYKINKVELLLKSKKHTNKIILQGDEVFKFDGFIKGLKVLNEKEYSKDSYRIDALFINEKAYRYNASTFRFGVDKHLVKVVYNKKHYKLNRNLLALTNIWQGQDEATIIERCLFINKDVFIKKPERFLYQRFYLKKSNFSFTKDELAKRFESEQSLSWKKKNLALEHLKITRKNIKEGREVTLARGKSFFKHKVYIKAVDELSWTEMYNSGRKEVRQKFFLEKNEKLKIEYFEQEKIRNKNQSCVYSYQFSTEID